MRGSTEYKEDAAMDLYMDPTDRQFMDLWQSVDRLYGDYARSKGLTFMSFNVLDIICHNEGSCTQKRICEETQYPKQSVNLIIKGFLERGYVELREMPADRRNKLIRLTPEGLSYAEEILEPVRKAERAADAELTAEEWAGVLHLLKRYAARLTQEMDSL